LGKKTWFAVCFGVFATSCAGGETELTDSDGERPTDDAGVGSPEVDASRSGDEPSLQTPSSPWSCEEPQVATDDPAQPFARLDATVVDEHGQGVPNLLAQACGTNLCLADKTDASGDVALRQDPAVELRRAAFKYGDGLRYAQFARLLSEESEHSLGEQRTFAFPALGLGEPFRVGERLTSSGVVLDLSETLAVRVDVLSFPDTEEQVFVAQPLPSDSWPEAVPKDAGLEVLVALGPVKTKFCPPARLDVENTAGWPPGAEVEVLLHVTDALSHWGAYGTFSRVSLAQVDEAGERVTTNVGEGLPELGVVGLRLAP
jgi:hypothetical protein